MALVNAKEMLQKAYEGKYAVAQININNLEWAKAALETAEGNNSPIILGVTEGAAKYQGGFNAVVGMVKGLIKDLSITVPVAIHLDHGMSVDAAKNAIDAGFTSVMFDGSHSTIDLNVAGTKEVVEYANKFDVSVEAEVGTVGGEEDGVIGGINFAKKEEVVAIAKAGAHMIAASLGSVHGDYIGEPDLQFDMMKDFSSTLNMPLVLHGGSGIPAEMIKEAIASGQAKINVNTEVQQAWAKAVRTYIESGADKKGTGFDPRKVLAGAIQAMKDTIKGKMELFGSIDKA